MAKRDYYEILGVQRTATDAEMKASYRKLAMKWHPDRNPGDKDCEHHFKEINEAYDVLKDEQKRAAYDRFGHAAFEHGGGGGRTASVRTSRRASRISSKTCSAWAAAGGAAAAASAARICVTTWRSRWRRPSPVRPRRCASRPRSPARRVRAQAPRPAPSRRPVRP